ncbi:hypothetical protein ACWCWD_04005 [Streptomyces sp. NPDC001493]
MDIRFPATQRTPPESGTEASSLFGGHVETAASDSTPVVRDAVSVYDDGMLAAGLA